MSDRKRSERSHVIKVNVKCVLQSPKDDGEELTNIRDCSIVYTTMIDLFDSKKFGQRERHDVEQRATQHVSVKPGIKL